MSFPLGPHNDGSHCDGSHCDGSHCELTPGALDRLVDGELTPDEYRALLQTIEMHPDGWRRCALAFLEAQAWGQELTGLRNIQTAPSNAHATANAPTAVAGATNKTLVGGAGTASGSSVETSVVRGSAAGAATASHVAASASGDAPLNRRLTWLTTAASWLVMIGLGAGIVRMADFSSSGSRSIGGAAGGGLGRSGASGGVGGGRTSHVVQRPSVGGMDQQDVREALGGPAPGSPGFDNLAGQVGGGAGTGSYGSMPTPADYVEVLLPGQNGGPAEKVRLPVYDVGEEFATAADEVPSLSPSLSNALRQIGRDVRRRRQVMTLPVDGGREMFVPLDRYEIVPVGNPY